MALERREGGRHAACMLHAYYMTEMGWKHGNIRMLNLGLWKVKAKYLYEWTRLTRSCGRLQKTLPLSQFHCVFALHPTESFHLPCGKAILSRLNPMLSFTPRAHPHNMDFQESIANCKMFFLMRLGQSCFSLAPWFGPLKYGIWHLWKKTLKTTHILEQKDAMCFYTSLAALRLTMPSQPVAPLAPSMHWWLARCSAIG